jgi:hypothetical protein
MSDTRTQPGSSRKSPRQLLTAARTAPRKLRIVALTGLIGLAGTAALVDVPAAANASTIVNPSCPVRSNSLATRCLLVPARCPCLVRAPAEPSPSMRYVNAVPSSPSAALMPN